MTDKEHPDIIFNLYNPPNRNFLQSQIVASGKPLREVCIDKVLAEINSIYEIKGNVYQEEVAGIVEEYSDWCERGWRVLGISTNVDLKTLPKAVIQLQNPDGKDVVAEAVGESSAEAIFIALGRATNVHFFMEDFIYDKLAPGINSLGKATVCVRHHNQDLKVSACSVDMLIAAAKAFLVAVNIVNSRKRMSM